MSVHLERLARRDRLGIKRGLDNVRALLERLGHPERAYPVVLLGGTNGKGSTGAFLARALGKAGHGVGWTSSPHLVSVTERIRVRGRTLAEPELEALLGEVFEAEAGLEATYFELTVAAALLAFARAGVDLALVEVGLGGRWDSTNATEPLLSVLTSVGLDHQAFLGETRETIAREKLCIAREGRPLVLGPGLDPAWVAPLLECAPRLCPAPALALDRLAWDHSVVAGHRVGLAGAHQVANLATALEVLHHLGPLGFPVPEATLWEAAASTTWPGRLWAVPGLSGVWMDGAHNPEGVEALAAHARACAFRPHLYFGAMRDKDLEGMAEVLKGLEPLRLTFVRGPGERYADGPRLARAWGLEAPCLDIPAAAAALRAPEASPRLVAGSLYLLGDLLRELGVDPAQA